MIKKTLTLMASVLMVSGAWADDASFSAANFAAAGETVTRNNVTYNITDLTTPNLTSYSDTPGSISYSLSYTNEAAAIIVSSTIQRLYSSVNVNGTIVPTSFTGTTISLESWQLNYTDNTILPSNSQTIYSLSNGTDLSDDEWNTQIFEPFIDACYNIKTNGTNNNAAQSLFTGSEIKNLASNSLSYDKNGEEIDNSMYYCYYRVKTGGTVARPSYTYYCLPIYDITWNTETSYGFDNSCYLNYNIYSIPASFLTSSVTSLNIPSTVTTIADAAFANVSASLTSITATGNFIKWNDDFLMDAAKTTIYYVTPGANGKTINDLPSDVTTIKPYAMKNCKNVTINTTNTLSVGDNNNIAAGTDHNHINMPTALQVNGTTITGGLTQTTWNNFNKSSLSAGTSYDCSGLTVLSSTTISGLPNNCLLFFGQTNLVSGTNVVYTNSDNADICNNLELQDGTPYVNTIKEFTAKKSKLYRNFTNDKWATVYAPISMNDVGDRFNAFKLSSYVGTTLTFEKVSGTTGNVPYLVKNISGSTVTYMEGTDNAQIKKSDDPTSTIKGNATFAGTYETISITTQTNYYGISSKGTFAHALSGASFGPFRGYFTISSSAPEFNINFVDEDGNDIDFETGSTNEIEAIEETKVNDNIYDLNGNVVNEITTPGLYINNGKKIIIK